MGDAPDDGDVRRREGDGVGEGRDGGGGAAGAEEDEGAEVRRGGPAPQCRRGHALQGGEGVVVPASRHAAMAGGESRAMPVRTPTHEDVEIAARQTVSSGWICYWRGTLQHWYNVKRAEGTCLSPSAQQQGCRARCFALFHWWQVKPQEKSTRGPPDCDAQMRFQQHNAEHHRKTFAVMLASQGTVILIACSFSPELYVTLPAT